MANTTKKQIMETASDLTNQLQDTAEDLIDETANTTQKLSKKIASKTSDGVHKACDCVKKGTSNTMDYVRKNPGKSLGIAAAIGGLIVLATHSKKGKHNAAAGAKKAALLTAAIPVLQRLAKNKTQKQHKDV